MPVNNLFSEEKTRLVYKLLHDLLFILVIFFILALVAEGLLPGIVSSHIGLYKIILLILLVIFSINMVSKKAGIVPSSTVNENIKYAFLFILVALIFNGMLKLGLPISISILIFAMFFIYLSVKIFFDPAN